MHSLHLSSFCLFFDYYHSWSKFDEPVPGWVLPASWNQPDSESKLDGGPRRYGWLTFTYVSIADRKGIQWGLRLALRKKTLAGLKLYIWTYRVKLFSKWNFMILWSTLYRLRLAFDKYSRPYSFLLQIFLLTIIKYNIRTISHPNYHC